MSAQVYCNGCRKRRPASRMSANGTCIYCLNSISALNTRGRQTPAEQRKAIGLTARCAKYGLSVEQYDAMLVAQGGRCAICGATGGRRALNIDHDHATGVVRELLCTPCNTALGQMEDDTDRLRSALAYLERHKNR